MGNHSNTVRAAVTSRVAPGETTKRLGDLTSPRGFVRSAILPAATAEFHHNVHTRYFGDQIAGIDRSLS